MPYYTTVTLSMHGHQIARATRADIGRPNDQHRYVVTGITWSPNGRRTPWLDYLDHDCQVNASGGDTGRRQPLVDVTLHISSITGDGGTVYLD